MMIVNHFFVLTLCGYTQTFGLNDLISLDRQPFGLKMCGDLCARLKNCYSYTFCISSLSCFINGDPTNPGDGGFSYNISQKISNTCNARSAIVQTRAWKDMCLIKESAYKGKERDGIIILMANTWNNKIKLRLYFTRTNRLQNYTIIKVKNIFAVAYMRERSEILIALSHPFRICSYPLYSKNFRILVNTSTKDIAVDDSRDLVFISMIRKRGIGRMTGAGKELKCLLRPKKIAICITLDRQHKLIYFASISDLMSVTYNGENRKTLRAGEVRCRGIAVDDTGNCLYYTSGQTLHKFNIADRVDTVQTSFKSIGWRIRFHRQMLYVSFIRSTYLTIIDTVRHSTVNSIDFCYELKDFCIIR